MILRQMFDIRHVMRIRQSHNFTALMMLIRLDIIYDTTPDFCCVTACDEIHVSNFTAPIIRDFLKICEKDQDR
jgi:hypothetical protein